MNNQLSQENKRFLASLKNNHGVLNYAFVWCHEGTFFIRKLAGEKAMKIVWIASSGAANSVSWLYANIRSPRKYFHDFIAELEMVNSRIHVILF